MAASPFDLLAPGSTPLGVTYPPRAMPPLPTHDARSRALERLKEFLSRVTFRRPMASGQPPEAFRVPAQQIHTYQPDDIVPATVPSIAFVPGLGATVPIGLGPAVSVDDTEDVYGEGTVLYTMGDHEETFVIDILAAKHAVRRAIVAGLEVVMGQGEESPALRLSLPDYYDRVATFLLGDVEYVDDGEVVKNRRRARVMCGLSVPKVLLVNRVTMQLVLDYGGDGSPGILDGNYYLDLDGTVFEASSVRRGSCFGAVPALLPAGD